MLPDIELKKYFLCVTKVSFNSFILLKEKIFTGGMLWKSLDLENC